MVKNISLICLEVKIFVRVENNFISSFYDKNAIAHLVKTRSPRAAKLDYDLNNWAQAVKMLVSTLEEALNKRVSEIGVMFRKLIEWEVTDEVPKDLGKIFISLKLNPEFCFSIIDKGPEANLPEVRGE